MKKLYQVAIIVFFSIHLSAQDYILNPTHLNTQGNPTDLLLASLHVINPTEGVITIHVKRILVDFPPNWTTCFCYPTCVAPFIDTLTFTVKSLSSDSIKPNFGTSSIPGIGYVTITLFQVGYPENIDTITFSGSTLPSSVKDEVVSDSDFAVYPNPFNQALTVSNSNELITSLTVFNSLGDVIYDNGNISAKSETIDLEEFPNGIYLIQTRFESGVINTRRIVKSIF